MGDSDSDATAQVRQASKRAAEHVLARLYSSPLYGRLSLRGRCFFVSHCKHDPDAALALLDEMSKPSDSPSDEAQQLLRELRQDADRRVEIIWRSFQLVAVALTLLFLFFAYAGFKSSNDFERTVIEKKRTMEETVALFSDDIDQARSNLANDITTKITEQIAATNIQAIMKSVMNESMTNSIMPQLTNQFMAFYMNWKTNDSIIRLSSILTNEIFNYEDASRYVIGKKADGASIVMLRLAAMPDKSTVEVITLGASMSGLNYFANIVWFTMGNMDDNFARLGWTVKYSPLPSPEGNLSEIVIKRGEEINVSNHALGNYFTMPDCKYVPPNVAPPVVAPPVVGPRVSVE